MSKRFACLALALALAPLFGPLHADDDDQGPPQEQYEPPPPVGVDAEVFDAPKNTLYVGLRSLNAGKVSFSGTGTIEPAAPYNGDTTSTSAVRVYNDGTVIPDTRTDANGNPIKTGQTAAFSYQNANQISPDGQYVSMHEFTAVLAGAGTDAALLSNPGGGNASGGSGFELTLERDMGWHLGRLQISLVGGIGLNSLRYSKSGDVPVTALTVETTVFQLTPAPFTGTGSASTTFNPTVSDTPVAQTTDTVNDPADYSATDTWHINGASMTFRVGPKLTLPISHGFEVSASAGAALVYAGSTFTVDQVLKEPAGDTVTAVSDGYSGFMPGYFANADLQYWVTDTAGFYAGAVFQSSSSYTQLIYNDTGSAYQTKIDLTGEEGMHMGMQFKF